jgi:hypothetical protein
MSLAVGYSCRISGVTDPAINTNYWVILKRAGVSQGTLSSSFDKNTTLYDLTFSSIVSSITLQPTAEEANSTIKIDGVEVASGAIRLR